MELQQQFPLVPVGFAHEEDLLFRHACLLLVNANSAEKNIRARKVLGVVVT